MYCDCCVDDACYVGCVFCVYDVRGRCITQVVYMIDVCYGFGGMLCVLCTVCVACDICVMFVPCICYMHK